MRISRWTSLVVAGLLAAGLLSGSGAEALTVAPAAPSGPGTHDTLFPHQGNAGYDARHYDVRLRYEPTTNELSAVSTLTARALGRRDHVSLDFAPALTVRRVTVDGRPATFTRPAGKLVVTPAHPVRGRFRVAVTYDGVPQSITDADGSSEGWIRTPDGGIGLGEPVGTMAWVPCDDTPGDKASWTFHVDVPSSVQAAANGTLVSRQVHGDRTTWLWRERDPMASYLATVAVGDFHVYRSTVTSVTGRRIPAWSFVDPTSGTAAGVRAQLPAVVRFEERHFGPYPFDSTGMIIDNADVGYALETQTRPFYPGSAGALVHEMAHQWYGDSVSLTDWHDIWLAEGFATYAEWLWDAAHGGPSTHARFTAQYATPASSSLWHPSPRGFTDSKDLFGSPVYTRGAMTLEVLRERIGDRDFAHLLHAWARAHRHGNTTTHAFVRLAERISGKPLNHLFHVWLDRPGKPAGY